jgi:S1-C subfamily serine protease
MNENDSAEKITIRPEEVTPRQSAGDAPVTVILKRRLPISEISNGTLAWATFVPFLNSWLWFRRSRTPTEWQRLQLAAAIVLGLASIGSVLGLALYALLPESDWIEQIAADAHHSVVRIENEDSLGTGFVISSRGNRHLILSNKHVLQDVDWSLADSVELPETCHVVLSTGEKLPVTLVGMAHDEDVDLVLLRVESEHLRPLGRIKPFDQIRIGERVVAVGNPLGLDMSVTEGIISAKRGGRMLQTSAAINPGNSGGPLLDKHGYIVGVNTAKSSKEQSEGIGFALRADIACHANAWRFVEDASDLLNQIQRD